MRNIWSHWEIFQDYCVYCGRQVPYAELFSATCSCNRFNEPHYIQRRLCSSCKRAIRKEVENAGFTTVYILNNLERRFTHGEVIWG